MSLGSAPLPHWILAQSETSSSIFFWVAILVVIVFVLIVALAIVRKRMSPDEDFHGEGFSLSDLRQMHKSGQLSEEEFERAKAKMVETMQAAQARRDAARAEAAKQAQQGMR